jgi:membrane protein DedA with SNARE-associated domain/membrane-associated phospholipid phosphatase
MIEGFFDTLRLLGQWGYLVIFLLAFLESSAFLGLLVPGEIAVITAGFLASKGYLRIGDCLLVVAAGALLGDSAGYFLGKLVGRGYFERHRRLLLLRERHVRKAEEYFRRHGGKTVLLGRFINVLRTLAPFAAGMSRMPYRRFLPYNAAGGIMWSLTFTLLGYFFGHSWRLIEKWSGRAGAFVFFLVLLVVAFAYLYKAISRREAAIHGWLSDRRRAAVESRAVRRFKERHPALVHFLRHRLSPEGYLGMHLAAGFAACALFAWVFARITEYVASGGPFLSIDTWVLGRVLYFKTPAVTKFMEAFTVLGGRMVVGVGSLALAILFLYRKRFDYVIALVSAVSGGSALTYALKAAAHGQRLPVAIPAVPPGGWSFPSGHAMISVVFYGMAAYLMVRVARRWKTRVLAVTAVSFVVFMIGLSRIYLQVHYLSDVVAGYVGGLLWLTVCVTGIEIYRIKAETYRR